MTSQKLLEFYVLHYQRGYQIRTIELSGNKNGTVYSKVELFKNGDSVSLESDEYDFHLALAGFKQIMDQNGLRKLVKVNDAETYYQTIQDLLDLDGSKVHAALQEAKVGKSPLRPGFWHQLDTAIVKLLFENTKPNDPDVEWLLRNHFRFLAFYLTQTALLQRDAGSKLRAKHEDIPTIIAKAQVVLRNGFLVEEGRPNVLQVYEKYCRLLPDTLEDHTTRMAIQVTYRKDLNRMLKHSGSREKRMQVLYALDMYRRYYELADPIVNLLRIAVQLHANIEAPPEDVSEEELVGILVSSGNEELVKEFMPVIRNCESHLATRFDESSETVLFTKRKGLRRITELKLTYEELLKKMLYLGEVLVPALYYAFSDFDNAMKLMLISSGEYKQLLVTKAVC